MLCNKNQNNSSKFPAGATSLLIVTAIALVFVAIVTGLTAFSIREARQALDTDLSNRAYAAAIASARDGSQWVSEHPGEQYPNCDGSNATIANPQNLIKYQLSTDSTNPTSIECRTITIDTAQVQLQAQKDKTVQILTYLPNSTPVTQMKLQWGTEGGQLLDINNLYPISANWDNNTPALIELNLVHWTKAGSGDPSYVSPSELNQLEGLNIKTTLLNPSTPNCTNTANTDGYYCSAIVNFENFINGAASQNIAVIIRPRYRDTNFKTEFYGPGVINNGAAVTVRPTSALIDVTAVVGGFYRRVQAQKALSGNSFINDVLYSNSNICKNLTVTQSFGLLSANNCS